VSGARASPRASRGVGKPMPPTGRKRGHVGYARDDPWPARARGGPPPRGSPRRRGSAVFRSTAVSSSMGGRTGSRPRRVRVLPHHASVPLRSVRGSSTARRESSPPRTTRRCALGAPLHVLATGEASRAMRGFRWTSRRRALLASARPEAELREAAQAAPGGAPRLPPLLAQLAVAIAPADEGLARRSSVAGRGRRSALSGTLLHRCRPRGWLLRAKPSAGTRGREVRYATLDVPSLEAPGLTARLDPSGAEGSALPAPEARSVDGGPAVGAVVVEDPG
jgi:hypothetical protein